MSELVFYTNPMSRGCTARWMMEELGQPYEAVILEYGPAMKSPEYLGVNPMGKVPALKHGDRIVTETAAICAYLADAFPDAGLAPPPADRAAYYRWMFFAAGPIDAAMMDKARSLTPEGQLKAMSGYGDIASVLHAADLAVQPGPWICGEQFTAADVYFGSSLEWATMFKMMEPTPAIAAYIERLQARPAHARARAIDEALRPDNPAPEAA